jgi:hypothetical protein
MLHWILAAPCCIEFSLVLWGARREEIYNRGAEGYVFVPHYCLCEQSMMVVSEKNNAVILISVVL